MIRTYFFSTFFLFLTHPLVAQSTEKETRTFGLSLEGMLGFSVGEDFYSINAGGPSLFLNLNKNWKIGASAFPSFYFLDGLAGARLGVGPRVDYKNFVFIAPFYYRESANEWIWSVGFGYKFHKKEIKKQQLPTN